MKELKEQFRAEPLRAPLIYVDTPVKKLIRRVAGLFDVHDAKINVSPLDGWVVEEAAPAEASPVANTAAMSA